MTDTPYLIARCEKCRNVWAVDYERCPCECEDSEWILRTVDFDDD